MITVAQVLQHLESIAPLAYQESYDNSGLIVGDERLVVTGILVSLDVTTEVLEEALALGCNVVVSHHPIIFRGLKSLTERHFVERTVRQAIRHGINLIAWHTNLDNVLAQGVNSRIATRLGLEAGSVLAPAKDVTPGRSIGAGFIGHLPTPMPALDFLTFVKERMCTPVIRHTFPLPTMIYKVAICGGSGSFLLPQAIAQGAQALVTADFKYHDFFEADGLVMVVDVGHYESEQFTIGLLQDVLAEQFSALKVSATSVQTNPVHYLF